MNIYIQKDDCLFDEFVIELCGTKDCGKLPTHFIFEKIDDVIAVFPFCDEHFVSEAEMHRVEEDCGTCDKE